ncbi:hypothetical protein [Bythopirellula goksoeyrii]|uniref:Uncharacterized protein n=1 Tax=Bythopirellula goksoeyrii TaxID=1400387 RepID=A0A5B9QB40_9BACT|nr:hypothetical protein [Bythopirellula goksoeyrii]QEG34770.1 hypothetical protein Pr1d_20540 [Bythopirellula goksoeyrii]
MPTTWVTQLGGGKLVDAVHQEHSNWMQAYVERFHEHVCAPFGNPPTTQIAKINRSFFKEILLIDIFS